jgi:hypothetical protein
VAQSHRVEFGSVCQKSCLNVCLMIAFGRLSEREAYHLLGLTHEATPLEVRAAFRRRVIERHPDTGGDAGDKSTVQDLVDAYRLFAGPASATSEVGSRRSR